MTKVTARPTSAPKSVAAECDQKETDKKKECEARVWLINFQERLEAGCDSLDTPEKWAGRVKELKDFVLENADVVPAKSRSRLNEAIRRADAVQLGLDDA